MAASIWGLLISILNTPTFTYTLKCPNMARITNISTNTTNNIYNNHNNNHNYNHNPNNIININTSSTTRIIPSLTLTPFHPPPLTLVFHHTPLSPPVT